MSHYLRTSQVIWQRNMHCICKMCSFCQHQFVSGKKDKTSLQPLQYTFVASTMWPQLPRFLWANTSDGWFLHWSRKAFQNRAPDDFLVEYR